MASPITVLGAGSWGSTLAWLLAGDGRQVSLYCRASQKAADLQKNRLVKRPIEFNLPESVRITDNLEDSLKGAEIIIFACPAQSMRDLASKVNDCLKEKSGLTAVSAAKGLELGTVLRMSEVLALCLPGTAVAALSGPNLAVEILNGLPTASVVASSNEQKARFVQQNLNTPAFRVYASTDLAGVELGGALKNVIAVAAGASDGLKLGTNAKSALITRGLAEITRLSSRLGAQADTLSGLAGMGDLIATCTSPLSRNYRLGNLLAEGKSTGEAAAQLGATAEGITTTTAVCELSIRLGIELPIAQQVRSTLNGDTTPQEAINNLMRRPLAME